MNLKSVTIRTSTWSLIVGRALVVAGCAGGPPTPREKGTRGGATLWAGAGAIIGSTTGSPGKGALIGGALGGFAGVATGGELQAQEQIQAEQQRRIYRRATAMCVGAAAARDRGTQTATRTARRGRRTMTNKNLEWFIDALQRQRVVYLQRADN